MWELIRANRRKSAVLVLSMAVLLLALGYTIGYFYIPPDGGYLGIAAAFILWAVLSLVAYFQGDALLLFAHRAKQIDKDDHPQLYNVVEEMTIASGHGKPPAVYIVNDPAPNAFAVGRKPEHAAVAVTSGLLGMMDRDELQGVVAHEMAHIRNRDVLLMTLCAVLLGSIVMISEVFLRSLWHSGGHSSRRSSRRFGGDSGGGGGIVIVIVMAVAVVLAVLAPILARLIYLAVSRQREYLADASAAVYTRFPEGLASALEKLGRGGRPLERATKATAPMYIVNPFNSVNLDAWSSTHPPLSERVRILRSIGGTVSYGAYQEAWNKVGHRPKDHIPKSALAAAGAPVRAPHPDAQKPRDRMREAGDLLRKVNRFVFVPCPCGLQIKLPPDYKSKTVTCPRCQRDLAVPVAAFATLEAVADQLSPREQGLSPHTRAAAQSNETIRIKRRGNQWQSFDCACGATKTLSPAFSAPQTRCDACGRQIVVESS